MARSSSAQKKKGSGGYAFIFAAIILAISAAAFYFLKPAKLSQLLDRPIPYIFDNQYYGPLSNYSKGEEHKEILLVYGPHGIGKTRGLIEFAKELQSEGRLIIDFDLFTVSQYASNEDFIKFICNEIIKSMQALVGTPYKASLLKQSLAKTGAAASLFANDVIGKKHFLGLIKDPILQKAAVYLISAVESVDAPANVKATNLFDAIEKLGESLRPIIIIHEPYRLYQTEGCSKYCVETSKFLGKLFTGYGKDSFVTGLIFDVANQTKIPMFKEGPYRFIRPFEFDPDIAQHAFVNKEKIFTAPQFKNLFNLFGGTGVYFALAHELLTSGYPFSEVADILLGDLKSSVLRQIKISSDPKAMQKVFTNIVEKVPKYPDVNSSLTTQLLSSGLFSYVSPELDRVEPATSALENVVNELKRAKFAQ